MMGLVSTQGASAQVVKEITKSEFTKKVADLEKNKDWKFLGNKPTIIDFYATWCGPCKRLSPIMEQLAKEYNGKVQFYKVDVDKERELATMFGIQSIPSILFIPKRGKPIMAQGALPKAELKKTIDSNLLK
ncbi:thioredoxin [Phocaeicola paurosaccharolyticus]|uniref:thioredoxin n=1 Tax=Phocaeicola paurosaccharolyticus TaxID=732242 RepID=UPI000A50EA01|nr:thioredoxin [Phocaeicola paurosaccharolyticus]